MADDDENYIADFPGLCAKAGIDTQPLGVAAARELEPALSDRLIAAYAVDDATIDPFKLSLDNIAHAQQLGAGLMVGFQIRRQRIETAILRNTITGRETTIAPEIVVNASGAWAAQVAALAQAAIQMVYSKGWCIDPIHRARPQTQRLD